MMHRHIIGAGGWSGHVAQEAADSLRSTSYARVLDLVSEGEIEGLVNGLQSVCLDGSPVQNADGMIISEGDCIVAHAQLFEPPLAEKAWDALQRYIFTHVCPLIFRKDIEPLRTGQFLEVSLTYDSIPGCPGAWIITSWEA